MIEEIEDELKKATWRYKSKEKQALDQICSENNYPSWQHAITEIVLSFLPLQVKSQMFNSVIEAKQNQIDQLIEIIEQLKQAELSKIQALDKFESIKEEYKI